MKDEWKTADDLSSIHPSQVPRPGIEPGCPPSEGGVVVRWTTRAFTVSGRGGSRTLMSLRTPT
jgi:hypothetical protein